MSKPFTFKSVNLTITPKQFTVEVKLKNNPRRIAADLFFFDTQDDAQAYVTKQNNHDKLLYCVRPCNPNDIATQYAKFITDIACGMIDECMREEGIQLVSNMAKHIAYSMDDCICDNWDAMEQSPSAMGWVGSNGLP